MTPEELARSLAAKFLENGNYEALGTPLSHATAQSYAQAAAIDGVEELFVTEDGFSGLAVHSVGYTTGREDQSVIIYVSRGSKKGLESVATEIEGISVKAKLLGRLKAGPAPAMGIQGGGNLFERNGRIACGSSCAPSNEKYAGTFGALIKQGATMLALSNNHVFAACNHTPVGMPILSPSTMDARAGRRAPTEICQHNQIVELRSGDPALVTPMTLDAAVAIVANEAVVTSWQGDDTNGYDTPTAAEAPTSAMKVKKFGRTTGLTAGVVEALVPTPWILPYKTSKFTAAVWFTDTWTIRTSDAAEPFALPGDSGSLVVKEDGSAAVGLLFAVNSGGQYGIVVPIEQVLAAFGNATFVSGHGI
jgi:hypothetical protein